MNELKIKLNEKFMEMKEEHRIEVEETVKIEIKSFETQKELQEKKQQFEMEKKELDKATKEDALKRALERKAELGKIDVLIMKEKGGLENHSIDLLFVLCISNFQFQYFRTKIA